MDIKEIIGVATKVFEKKASLDSLHQEIAENFYPERANFTREVELGEDFAAALTTSYPLLARRDLGNSFSAMLRPADREWFKVGVDREDLDNTSRRWLEWATGVQRRAMYARPTNFVRATREGDHDFAAFGQGVISVELNRSANDLLYRCWHLRDCAWTENADGKIDHFYRKWKPTARDLVNMFKGKVHPNVTQKLEKDPYCEINCMHIILPNYDKKGKLPYMSLIVDVDNMHMMEEVPSRSMKYIIPRWQTVSGSQYAYSPATVAALPDARLIQAMTLVLLEAGEKAVTPPMVAVQEAIRSDVQLFAGGITAVDAEYDERLGEVLRPITQDKSGIPLGIELREDVKLAIAEAFFLNKIGLPAPQGRDMTAFEVGQRVQEYIRNALPLFEPMEIEYNGAICEETFNLLLEAGAFGSIDDIPDGLRGADIRFQFESPLREAIERKKGQTFLEGRAILAQVAEIDPAAIQMVDAKVALRDVLNGIGTPAKWIRSEEDMEKIEIDAAQQREAQAMLQTMQQGGMVAEQMGKASQALQGMA